MGIGRRKDSVARQHYGRLAAATASAAATAATAAAGAAGAAAAAGADDGHGVEPAESTPSFGPLAAPHSAQGEASPIAAGSAHFTA